MWARQHEYLHNVMSQLQRCMNNGTAGELTAYEADVVAWAEQQAHLLRTGRFQELDIEHIAEEIEDVGKGEQRELASRMAVLLAHLIKWRYQPERRGHSWRTTIRTQRSRILRRTSSLANCLRDRDWWADAWDDAIDQATAETGLEALPETCPWSTEQILGEPWLPDDTEQGDP